MQHLSLLKMLSFLKQNIEMAKQKLSQDVKKCLS